MFKFDRALRKNDDGGGSDVGGGDNDAVEAEATTGTTGGGNAGVGGMGAGGGYGNMNDSDSDVTGISSDDVDLFSEMAKAGMDPDSFLDRTIAKAGIALGLPPDPSKSTPAGVLGALSTPLTTAMGPGMGLLTSYAMSKVENLNNPTNSPGKSTVATSINNPGTNTDITDDGHTEVSFNSVNATSLGNNPVEAPGLSTSTTKGLLTALNNKQWDQPVISKKSGYLNRSVI